VTAQSSHDLSVDVTEAAPGISDNELWGIMTDTVAISGLSNVIEVDEMSVPDGSKSADPAFCFADSTPKHFFTKKHENALTSSFERFRFGVLLIGVH